MKGRPLPIGIDDFAKLREGGYYYVDKTAFIGELWRNRGEVNLFTRPRRFGKTLNMSMLQYFFEDTGDEKTNERNRSLFEGLAVMEDGPAILGQMGRRPVISLSLKSAKQPDWELAYACIREEIAREYKRHLKAADSIVLAGDRQRFLTGYLKKNGERMEENAARISLAIPNAEVKYIYENTIKNWFMEDVGKRDLSGLYQALFAGNAEETEKNLSILLRQTISYMDSVEAFYHGFLLGVLGGLAEHVVRSNREAGNGRLDICVYSMDTEQPPLILELKASPSFDAMEASCQQALAQIEEKAYDAWLPQEGYREAWLYGIAFYKKQCRVKVRHKFYVTV